ncbi:PepSY domain-containing protein [Colwellia sp. MEBiC06753]
MKKLAVILGLIFGCSSALSFDASALTYVESYADRGAERSADKKPKNQKRVNPNTISASQAANNARSKYGGKVLKVQQAAGGYRVKVITTDGRVISVFVDGTTGRVKG